MANYCAGCDHGWVRNGTPNNEVLGDFEEFFYELQPQLVTFLRGELCFPSVCEGHGTMVCAYMDWHGGFWLLHHPGDDQPTKTKGKDVFVKWPRGGWGKVPKPMRVPEPRPLTARQQQDLDQLRGWSADKIKECLEPELYEQLVALGVPPNGPSKVTVARGAKQPSKKWPEKRVITEARKRLTPVVTGPASKRRQVLDDLMKESLWTKAELLKAVDERMTTQAKKKPAKKAKKKKR
jgi:hypothetical protein